MINHIFNELSDMEMETISGGHRCHKEQHHNRCGGGGMGGGLMGELRGLLAALGKVGSNSNISIVIIENSTINAPVTISVNQKA